ncbi:MAG: hypothetical protein ACI8Y4_004419 [Candidatus Poriferisodalaceae bacterium]|jgi:hypothetical protein
MESVEVIRPLFDGETVQPRLPILVGGNGQTFLAPAGAHADIVGLQGLRRTKADGHSHTVKWGSDWLDTQIEQIRSGAGDRIGEVEVSALVQVTRFTSDSGAFIEEAVSRIEGLSADDARITHYLLFGTPEEMATKIRVCRERWGISYFVVGECAAFADVISELR